MGGVLAPSSGSAPRPTNEPLGGLEDVQHHLRRAGRRRAARAADGRGHRARRRRLGRRAAGLEPGRRSAPGRRRRARDRRRRRRRREVRPRPRPARRRPGHRPRRDRARRGSLHDTILVKTHRMRVVEIDPESRRARAQAGALWADVVGPASEHGLAALAGSSHDVGVVGYCLGGGLSWLARKHGLAANSVAAVADRHRRRARRRRRRPPRRPTSSGPCAAAAATSASSPPSSSSSTPSTELYAGMLAFPVERAAEVLRAWREWVRTVPDEATSVGRILHFPPLDGDPGADARAVVRRGRDGLPRRRGGRVGAARAAARARPRDGHVRAIAPADLLRCTWTRPTRCRGRRRRAARRHARRGHRRPRGCERRRTRRCSRSSCATSAARSAGRAEGHGALATLEGDFALFAVGMAPHDAAAAAVKAHLDVVEGAVCEWDARPALPELHRDAVDTRSAYSRGGLPTPAGGQDAGRPGQRVPGQPRDRPDRLSTPWGAMPSSRRRYRLSRCRRRRGRRSARRTSR